MSETCPVEFYADTDITVTLGGGKRVEIVPVRYLNDEDYEDVIRKLYQAFKQRKTVDALRKLKIKAEIHAFIASALSNPDEGRVISIGFLRSCPPSQMITALQAIFAGNKAEILQAWQLVPEGLRAQFGEFGKGLFSQIGGILKSGINLNQMIDDIGQVVKHAADSIQAEPDGQAADG